MADFSAMWSLSQLDWRLRLAQQRQDRRWQVQAATADATGLTCFKFRFLRRPQREQRLSFSKKAFSSTEVIQMQNVMKSLMRGARPAPLKTCHTPRNSVEMAETQAGQGVWRDSTKANM